MRDVLNISGFRTRGDLGTGELVHTAIGYALDALAEDRNIKRRKGEADAELRERLINAPHCLTVTDDLASRRERLAAQTAALARDERDATARAVDTALELVRALAASPSQRGRLREQSGRVAAALEPYLRALDAGC